jgi:chromosomal replication initiation ATPase DnaA
MARLTAADIVRIDALLFIRRELGVSLNDLASHRRQAELVWARALFVHLVKTHGPADLSYPAIGRWLGGRDHTSIMHLYRIKAVQLRERDARFCSLCIRFAAWFADRKEASHGHAA